MREGKEQLRAYVHKVERLTPTIVEVVIKAPAAARNFRPGQFFRLQNYESHALKTAASTMAMEGLAMTGAWVDAEGGLVSVIVLEVGGSSLLCAKLKEGEPVVLMGPTGTPTEILENETVALIGGGLGNAVLFSIGKAMRGKNCKVIYFAGYKQNRDRFKVADIEAASDVVVWACDEPPTFTANRAGDMVFHGNILKAVEHYARQNGGIPLAEVSRVIAIGSDGMMAAVAAARNASFAGLLRPDYQAIGSINSPMQCMMKEICAQCLQRHTDPATGLERYVYSCTNQDQNLDEVDFPHLHSRLQQNSLQEKLTALWVRECLKET